MLRQLSLFDIQPVPNIHHRYLKLEKEDDQRSPVLVVVLFPILDLLDILTDVASNFDMALQKRESRDQ